MILTWIFSKNINALSVSVNAFSMEVLIEDTIFRSPAGNGGPPFYDVVIRAS